MVMWLIFDPFCGLLLTSESRVQSQCLGGAARGLLLTTASSPRALGYCLACILVTSMVDVGRASPRRSMKEERHGGDEESGQH